MVPCGETAAGPMRIGIRSLQDRSRSHEGADVSIKDSRGGVRTSNKPERCQERMDEPAQRGSR